MQRGLGYFALCLSMLGRFALGAIDIGDSAPNLCWDKADEDEVCLHDYKKQIRVLIYTNGHCPQCTTLVTDLITHAKEVRDQKVWFINLSTEGPLVGGIAEEPSSSFLTAWTQSFKLAGHPLPGTFVIAASPRDAGRAFYEMPDIPQEPNVILIDADEDLAWRDHNPTANDVIAQIKKLKQSN